MKTIVYLITSNGIDGRDSESILGAFTEECVRNKAFDQDKYKCYLSKVDRILDLEQYKKQTIQKLNALDKFVLGL